MTRSSNPTFISLVRRLLLVFLLVPSIDGCSDAPLSQSNPIPSSVQLDRAQPSVWSTVGGVPLHLYGHGFEPGTKVQFGDGPPTEGKFVSEQELEIMIPSRLGQIGPVRISVIPPRNDCASGACAVTRNDLFRYSASQVAFASPPQIIPTGDSSCKDGRLFWLEERAERIAGVVMFCNQYLELSARLFLFRQRQDGSLGPSELIWKSDKWVGSVSLNNCQSGHCNVIILTTDSAGSKELIQVFEFRNATLRMLQQINATPEYWHNGDKNIFSGDINGDKQEDIIRIVGNGSQSATYSILRQSANEPFENDAIFEKLPSIHDNILAAADLDHDGKTDLITDGYRKRWIVWNDLFEGETLYPTRAWNEEEFPVETPGVVSVVNSTLSRDTNIVLSETDPKNDLIRFSVLESDPGVRRLFKTVHSFSLGGRSVRSSNITTARDVFRSEIVLKTQDGLRYYRLSGWNRDNDMADIETALGFQAPIDDSSGNAILVMDIDKDGIIDVVGILSNGIFVTSGVGTESRVQSPPSQSASSTRRIYFPGVVRSLQVLDLNRDGIDDVLVGTDRGLKILEGSIDGRYIEKQVPIQQEYSNYRVQAISIITESIKHSEIVREFVAILGSDGEGAFMLHGTIGVDYSVRLLNSVPISSTFCPIGGRPWLCSRGSSFSIGLIAGIAQDPVKIIISDYKDSQIIFIENWQNIGSIDTRSNSPRCNALIEMQSADLNGDGVSDLVLSCGDPSGIYVHISSSHESLQNNGHWLWSQAVPTPTLYDHRLYVVDYDRDGHFELLTDQLPANIYCSGYDVCTPDVRIEKLRLDSSGFDTIYRIAPSKRRLCGTIDSDGDGIVELLTCDNSIYLNGHNSSVDRVAKGDKAYSGDLNGDGKQDLVVLEGKSIVIYENLSQ